MAPQDETCGASGLDGQGGALDSVSKCPPINGKARIGRESL